MEIATEVLVVDDRRLVGEAITAFLNGSGLNARAIPPGDLDGVVPGRGLALVSLGTASRGEHVAMLAAARWRVVVYGVWDEGQVARAVSDGAVGFVSGASRIDELAAEVRGVLSGRGGFSVVERARLAALALQARRDGSDVARGLASLTPRECEVLDALLQGRRVADIAADSYVSVTTVRNQVQSILTKLNVHSQLEAVAAARRHHWELEPR
jgi:DNA-binding NarL/FixJ family response regulator